MPPKQQQHTPTAKFLLDNINTSRRTSSKNMPNYTMWKIFRNLPEELRRDDKEYVDIRYCVHTGHFTYWMVACYKMIENLIEPEDIDPEYNTEFFHTIKESLQNYQPTHSGWAINEALFNSLQEKMEECRDGVALCRVRSKRDHEDEQEVHTFVIEKSDDNFYLFNSFGRTYSLCDWIQKRRYIIENSNVFWKTLKRWIADGNGDDGLQLFHKTTGFCFCSDSVYFQYAFLRTDK